MKKDIKILHISPVVPNVNSGGNLGILQSAYSLTHSGYVVDYLGFDITINVIREWYKRIYVLPFNTSPVNKLKSYIQLKFDVFYQEWKRLRINYDCYDIIFVEFTYYDYIIRDIRKSGYKGNVVVRVHNIEHDFFRALFQSNKRIINWFKKELIDKKERYVIDNSDMLVFLSEVDKHRMDKVYGINRAMKEILPVSVNYSCDQLSKLEICEKEKIVALVTGSLWFGPNYDAIKWMIDAIYESIKDICKIVIAGYKPAKRLIEICEAKGITLVDSPKDITPYFEEADIFLAPIFEGAGMKVKIAEAMSYGLPVVSTSFGFIGYNLKDKENCFVANSRDEFISSIREYKESGCEEKQRMRKNILKVYRENYCLEASQKRLKIIMTKLLSNQNKID